MSDTGSLKGAASPPSYSIPDSDNLVPPTGVHIASATDAASN